MTVHAAGSAELQRTQARVWFEQLRDDICAAIETLEREAPLCLFPDEPAAFTFKPWTRKSGEGGGVGGFLKNGRLFEKAGIHTSSANGVLQPWHTVYKASGAGVATINVDKIDVFANR